jgi:tetratricopeptide (TPR) repeat protein/predicted Ser/Thr protein kinase
MNHLQDNTLTEYVEGRLSPGESDAVSRHIDSCPSCRQLVAAAVAADAAPQGHSIGRYLVLDVLGVGGMGIVYAAYDRELDRRVALKVLRLDRDQPELRARLVREAKAMARLNHPRVITVYEIGTWEERVFIAMEYVDGGTLGSWLKERRRPWREVLATFMHAGHGLAAAHSAGLVHRDFKPDNVLMGKDGRVRVTDFGLARSADSAAPDIGSSDEKLPTLTRTGALAGTPAYMAPEQMRGEAPDARADVFSFCVALFEGLHGRRPFAGDDVRAIERAILDGNIIVTDDAAVPDWLDRALRGGLRAEPAARYPSMAALLEALERDPGRRLRRGLATVLATAALVAAGLWVRQVTRAQRLICRGAEQRLVGAWDSEHRGAVARAFVATGLPTAPALAASAQAALDRYAGAWVRMHTDACEATRVRGEQSEALLDLRMECLDDRRRELGALTTLFVGADAITVEKATSAVAALTPVSTCADTSALRARVRPPKDRTRVDALKSELSELQAMRLTGHYQAGQALAQRVLTEARALDYPPLVAQALYWLATMGGDDDDKRDLAPRLHDAAVAALTGGDDLLAARAWDSLAMEATRTGHRDEAQRYIRYASALLARAGGDGDQPFHVHLLAIEAEDENRLDDAVRLYVRSAEILERQGNREEAGQLYTHAAEALLDQGKLQQSEAMCRRSLAAFEKTDGLHPDLRYPFHCLGAVFGEERRYAEALEYFRRALAVEEAAHGADSPQLLASWSNIGNELFALKRPTEALAAYQKAQHLFAKSGERPEAAFTLLIGQAAALVDLGRNEDAIPLATRALQLTEAGSGLDRPANRAEAQFWLAKALVRRDLRRARGLAEEARRAFAAMPVTPEREEYDQEITAWLAAHR